MTSEWHEAVSVVACVKTHRLTLCAFCADKDYACFETVLSVEKSKRERTSERKTRLRLVVSEAALAGCRFRTTSALGAKQFVKMVYLCVNYMSIKRGSEA